MNAKSIFLIFSILALAMLQAGCAGSPEPAGPHPFLFDTDMAHEDMFAALFLLGHPDVDLKAITVSGTGEAHCEQGVQNALALAALAGRPGIPVACGRETPLLGEHQFPDDWRQAADAVYGVPLPQPAAAPSDMSAPELIAAALRESADPVTLVAVGPLTNVGEALRDHPELVDRIAAIYIMGGALKVSGNVGASGQGINNLRAEWNIYIDPLAANLVLDSGAPIFLVPLDATRDVPISITFFNTLGEVRDSPGANFVYDVLGTQKGMIGSGGFQFWDTFTSSTALQPELAVFEAFNIHVVEEEGPQSGWTQIVPDGAPVQAAVSGDRESFEALLIEILNR